MNLIPGFYVNLFEIHVPFENISIMKGERKKFPSFNDLREKIETQKKNIYLYAPERSNFVYAFGKDMKWLSNYGFTLDNINLHSEPQLTSYIILQGIFSKAKSLGYSIDNTKDKGRYKLFHPQKFEETSHGEVKIFQGYDIRIIFLKPQLEPYFFFGLIVDVSYKFRDQNDNSINFHDIVKKFGSPVLQEIRQIQKDLIPTGINTEVSKQRLLEDILPFIEEISEIVLPIKEELRVTIDSSPMQIIIGGDEL